MKIKWTLLTRATLEVVGAIVAFLTLASLWITLVNSVSPVVILLIILGSIALFVFVIAIIGRYNYLNKR